MNHACSARSQCINACRLHAGTTFKYVLASLLLPQDQTTTQAPPFKFDTTLGKPGFVDPSGAPVTVTLTTKVRAHALLQPPYDACMAEQYVGRCWTRPAWLLHCKSVHMQRLL